jgi:hypothetical protein
MCITYVDGPWECQIDTTGVTITYKSGCERYVRRMSRPDYRLGLEVSLRQLNAFEAALRPAEVVPIKRKRHSH